MQVDRGAAVGLGHLVVIHFAQPVVGRDGTGVGKDQAAHGIGDGGVLLDAPVVDLEVIVHQILVVEQGGADVADLLALSAVEDVCLGDIRVTGLGENLLDAVLDIFDRDHAVPDLGLKVRCDMKRDQIDDRGMILFFDSHESLGNGVTDLADLKIDNLSVSFGNLVHNKTPLVWCCISLLIHRILRGLISANTNTVPRRGHLVNILCSFKFSVYM